MVAVAPKHLAMGFELKVLSSHYDLNDQLDGQLGPLKLVAKRYRCQWFSQVAVLPDNNMKLATPAVGRLSIQELATAVRDVASQNQDSDLLQSIADQLEAAVALVAKKPAAEFTWNHVKLDELCRLARQPGSEELWVGYYAGLAKLRQATKQDILDRKSWKVAYQPYNPDKWFRLGVVVGLIEAALAS